MNPSKTCPNCQRSYPPETETCPVCGLPLEEIPWPVVGTPPGSPAAPKGTTEKNFNTVDASNSQGPVAVGSGARAVQVSGGIYIENQSTQDDRHCPNPACGQPVQPGDHFCTACGTSLVRKSPSDTPLR
jgi:predicted amidophosphoribosyltransferase